MSVVRSRFAPFIVLAVSAYGGGIELLQPFFGRDASLLDFAADVAGAALGAGMGAAAGHFWRK